MPLLDPCAAGGGGFDADLRAALRQGVEWCAHRAGLDAASCFGGGGVPADWAGAPLDYAVYYDWAVGLAADPADPVATGDLTAACVAHFARAFRRRHESERAGFLAHAAGPAVVTLAPPLFDAAASERIVRWLDLEPDNALSLAALDAGELERARRDIGRALAALAAWAPGFHGEMMAVVRQLIVVKQSGRQRLAFGGASSFALWGALVGNADAHRCWWRWMQTLVHETAHSILFALSRHAPLVDNDPVERYPSPLRDDPRPIDGIYHAAFVSAREVVALEQCLRAIDAGVRPAGLDEDDCDRVRSDCAAAREASVRAFRDCVAVLHRHARLTPSGRGLLAGLEHESDAWAGAVA